MADPQSMNVAEAASKFLCGEQADVVREAVRTVVAELMELEIAELTGAANYEGQFAVERVEDVAEGDAA